MGLDTNSDRLPRRQRWRLNRATREIRNRSHDKLFDGEVYPVPGYDRYPDLLKLDEQEPQ